MQVELPVNGALSEEAFVQKFVLQRVVTPVVSSKTVSDLIKTAKLLYKEINSQTSNTTEL